MSAAISVFAIVGCGESAFKGSSQKPQPRTEVVNLACGQNAASLVPPVEGVAGTRVKIHGSLCALTQDAVKVPKTSVVFVIDYSGSMATSDPSVGGSCGRLSAAQAIVSKWKSVTANGNEDSVEIGLVGFSSDASIRVPLMSLAQFEAQLTPINFCNNVGQTNYQAAFQVTNQMLSTVTGPRRVYFVSDGEPNTGSNPPNNLSGPDFINGKAAADALRASSNELKLDIIYLRAQASAGSAPEAALRQYLESLNTGIGSVKIVQEADQLVDAANQITITQGPAVSVVDKSSITAELVSKEKGSKKISLESFTPDPARQGVFNFVTEEVELFYILGQQTENRVVFRSQVGSIQETTGVVVFKAR